MTSVFKKILVIFTVCCLCASLLSSCSGGIDKDEAKAFINNFFDAVEAEDYEKAETFLHPDRPADLEKFFLNIESEENLDFQSGIEIEKHTGFSSSYYDSTVDGSTYTPTMRVKVGESVVKITEKGKNSGVQPTSKNDEGESNPFDSPSFLFRFFKQLIKYAVQTKCLLARQI